MCGITGFIDFKQTTSEEELAKMTDVLRHRGPDGFGMELIENGECQLGLGHRRL